MSGAVLELRGFEGTWCARFYDTWQGRFGPRTPVRAQADRLVLDVPEFSRDVALRLRRGCGS